MKQSLRRANVKWFSTKHKSGKRRRPSPMQLIGLRMRDLCILFRSRYSGHDQLPDDDAGREDLFIAINHLACLAHPRKHIADWIDAWAPWLTAGEQRDLVGRSLANPQRWTADQLAWRLRLTKEQRNMLGITTIGAIDESKAARTKRRREREKQRRKASRRAKGALPRQEYEQRAISRAKPWEAEGISRATWYRRQRGTTMCRETTPPTA
jgi:hypothetical protein